MGSKAVMPGDRRSRLGSPPSRWSTTSVVRRSALIFDTPATYRPSHFTRNLKFLYGSNRVGFTGNSTMTASSESLPAEIARLSIEGLSASRWSAQEVLREPRLQQRSNATTRATILHHSLVLPFV